MEPMLLGERELTEEETKQIHQAFRTLDTFGNGKISVNDLIRGAQILGNNPTREEAEAMICSCDSDADGCVDEEEFKLCMKREILMREYHLTRLKEAFEKFDKDKSGFLEKKELSRVLKNFGDSFTPEEEEEFFLLVDADNDGRVSLIEFVDFFACDMQQQSKG